MAEDDDDETFGDFTFAAAGDEWGDFVKSPQQSDNLYFNGIQASHTSVSPHTPWAKPTGALPLSIFGDVEGGDDAEDDRKHGAASDFNQKKTSGKAANLNSTHNSIANLYDLNSQIKPQNGMVDSVSVQNGFYSSSVINSTKSDLSEWGNVNFPATLGTGDHSQLTNNSDSGDFSFKSNVLDPSPNIDLFSVWTGESNGSTSDSNTTIPNVFITGSALDMNDPTAIADDDDDGGDEWEFKDADSEFQSVQVNNNVDLVDHRVSERSAYSSRDVSSSNKSLDMFGASNGSIDLFAPSTESVDYFATSSGVSSISQEVDLIGSQPSTRTLNGFIRETYSNIKQSNTESMLSLDLDVGETEFDEDFGDFTAATETVPETVDTLEADVLSPSKNAISTTDGKIQEKDMRFNYHEGALPLSIFGYEEPENGGSSDFQDAFMHQSAFDKRNSHTPTAVTSVNDLISSLYSQAEQTAPINTVTKPTEFSDAVPSSNLVNDADRLDDTSWDFKHASQTTFDAQASPYNIGDPNLSISSKLKPSNYLDFYSKLKKELCFFAKCHIESMKQARDSTTLIGEDATVASLDDEFQLMWQELEEMNFFEESNLPDRLAEISYLHELVEVLQEPEFQILESEYHLSHKLVQVEKDPRVAMELIRHTAIMLKILSMGTLEERTKYISVWSEMVSVCAQELKHGASIWSQALEKHVQNDLKSEPQGRKFVEALGEIYRVVVVVGASAKLFKPWALKSEAIYTLLEECHIVWSSSGLEEALSSVSVSVLESIKYILGLDALALQNHVFAEKGSLCRLSILNEKVAPGMKMINWGEEQWFVTVANVWTNLISHNPPKLPQLNLLG